MSGKLKQSLRKRERLTKAKQLRETYEARQHKLIKAANMHLNQVIMQLTNKIMDAGKYSEAEAKLILADILQQQRLIREATPENVAQTPPVPVLPSEAEQITPATFNRAAWGSPEPAAVAEEKQSEQV